MGRLVRATGREGCRLSLVVKKIEGQSVEELPVVPRMLVGQQKLWDGAAYVIILLGFDEWHEILASTSAVTPCRSSKSRLSNDGHTRSPRHQASCDS